MLFAGDDAEALGDGACTIANKATRVKIVNVGNIAKDFMAFSFFRTGFPAHVGQPPFCTA